MVEQPVFYDASGQRQKWSKRAVAAMLMLIVATALAFAATVVSVPVPQPIHPMGERSQARPVAAQIASLRTRIGKWLPASRQGAAAVDQVSVGFYVPWDPDSKASLARHIGQLDWVVPALASVTGGGKTVRFQPDRAFSQIVANAPRRPKILPMIQNAAADSWDGTGMAAILRDPARRKGLLDWTVAIVERTGGSGAVFDLEELPASARPGYLRFLAEARARFAPRGWLLTLALPVDNPDWPLAPFGKVADRVFLMNYDEHSPGDDPGPIASQAWFVGNLNRALKELPPGKAILAIGNYAYDWHDQTTDNMTDEEAWLAANDSEAEVRFDKASGNSTFSYEEKGTVHTIWMLDAASAWNQLRAADLTGVAGVALWRLGSEDPGYWPVLAHYKSGRLPDLSKVTPIGNVDVEGNGELLRIEATPRDGVRLITADASNLVRDQHFLHLPTPYVVRRGVTEVPVTVR